MTNQSTQLIIQAILIGFAVVMVIVQIVLFIRAQRKVDLERLSKVRKEERRQMIKQKQILGADIVEGTPEPVVT